MRVFCLSIVFATLLSGEEFAWRCGEPGAPKCPGGLCVHDLSLASDYCARGLIIADTPSGPTITVASPKASALLRRLQTKPTVGNE